MIIIRIDIDFKVLDIFTCSIHIQNKYTIFHKKNNIYHLEKTYYSCNHNSRIQKVLYLKIYPNSCIYMHGQSTIICTM